MVSALQRFMVALVAIAGFHGSAWAQTQMQSPTISLSRGTLDISGTMNADMLAAVEQQDWTKVAQIRFMSHGGLTEFSVPIARIFAKSGKHIFLHDDCSSACLDVLAIRKNVTIEPDTIVLLHNTPSGQALTAQDYPKISAFLATMGKKEEDWLTANGVDPRLLLFSESQIVPICVYAPFDGEQEAALNFATLIHFDAWAPRSTTLAHAGVQAARRWKQDSASIARNMQARYPQANLARLIAASEPMMPSKDDMVRSLSSIRKCPAGPPRAFPMRPNIPLVRKF